MGDEYRFHLRALEKALPVGIGAFLCRIDFSVSGSVDGFYRGDDIFGFHPIGADVLHGCGPYFTRYKGEVFHALPSLLNTVAHEVVPYGACSHAEVNVGIVLAGDGYVLDKRVEDGARIVAVREQEVAASADVQVGCTDLFRMNQFRQLLFGGILQEVCSAYIQPESVMCA